MLPFDGSLGALDFLVHTLVTSPFAISKGGAAPWGSLESSFVTSSVVGKVFATNCSIPNKSGGVAIYRVLSVAYVVVEVRLINTCSK